MVGSWRAGELPNAAEFDRHIRAHFASETHDVSSTDIGAAFVSFLRRCPNLLNWYAVLFEGSGLRVDWQSDGPTIPISHVSAWQRLCNEFEPDTLLTFDLAWKAIGSDDPSQTLARYSGWQTIPRATDHELDVLWSRGLADMHVHAGGVRIPQSVWLDLMGTARGQIALTVLLQDYKKRLGRDFWKDIEAAKGARMELALFAFGSREAPPRNLPAGDRWWSWHHSSLARERELLLRAWRGLFRGGAGQDGLAVALQRYLDHKHRFFSRAREPAFDSVPGLQYFTERYFRILQASPPRAKWKRQLSRYGASKRFEMAPIGDACQVIAESRHLRRVELRIPPFDRAPDYWRFFKMWNALKKQLDCAWKRDKRSPIDIRFAIHFKRSRGKQRNSHAHSMDRLTELDRQSAALRVAMACPERGRLLGALERIDVAGHERDTSLAIFAWHCRLLRENPAALRALEEDQIPPPWNAHVESWKRLKQRNLHKYVPGLRRLGMTVHAGEDFADVLDGIYQIATALDFCDLRAGDGIGHGLVLAAEVERSGAAARYATIPQGEAVDQLCWLWHAAEKFVVPGDLIVERARLEAVIMRAARLLYAERDILSRISVEDFIWLWETKVGLRLEWRREADLDGVRRELLALEADEGFWLERDRFEAIVPRDDVAHLVQAARRWLLKRVSDARVVVEMNPSSNLRISGADSTATLPTVFLAKAIANGLLACVNTDNPGVFVSCIENEFAILLDGLSADPAMNPDQVRETMEKARRIGMEILR